MKSELIEASEMVAPNARDNPWAHPMGYPVVLSDKRAYWFACAAGAGRAAVLLDKLDEVSECQERMQNQIPSDTDRLKPSDVFRKMTELAALCLALQYNDETLSRIETDGALDTKNLGMIVAVISGIAPGYEITVKKK